MTQQQINAFSSDENQRVDDQPAFSDEFVQQLVEHSEGAVTVPAEAMADFEAFEKWLMMQ